MNANLSLKKSTTGNVLPPVLANGNNGALMRPMSVENGHHKNNSLASSSLNSVANSQNSLAKSEFKTNFNSHSQHIIDVSKKVNTDKAKVTTQIYLIKKIKNMIY
jgi:hypothetical protein